MAEDGKGMHQKEIYYSHTRMIQSDIESSAWLFKRSHRAMAQWVSWSALHVSNRTTAESLRITSTYFQLISRLRTRQGLRYTTDITTIRVAQKLIRAVIQGGSNDKHAGATQCFIMSFTAMQGSSREWQLPWPASSSSGYRSPSPFRSHSSCNHQKGLQHRRHRSSWSRQFQLVALA